MTTHDSQQARAGAHDRSFPLTSADRARFWADLNRFLSTGSESGSAEPWTPAPVRVHRRTGDADE